MFNVTVPCSYLTLIWLEMKGETLLPVLGTVNESRRCVARDASKRSDVSLICTVTSASHMYIRRFTRTAPSSAGIDGSGCVRCVHAIVRALAREGRSRIVYTARAISGVHATTLTCQGESELTGKWRNRIFAKFTQRSVRAILSSFISRVCLHTRRAQFEE